MSIKKLLSQPSILASVEGIFRKAPSIVRAYGDLQTFFQSLMPDQLQQTEVQLQNSPSFSPLQKWIIMAALNQAVFFVRIHPELWPKELPKESPLDVHSQELTQKIEELGQIGQARSLLVTHLEAVVKSKALREQLAFIDSSVDTIKKIIDELQASKQTAKDCLAAIEQTREEINKCHLTTLNSSREPNLESVYADILCQILKKIDEIKKDVAESLSTNALDRYKRHIAAQLNLLNYTLVQYLVINFMDNYDNIAAELGSESAFPKSDWPILMTQLSLEIPILPVFPQQVVQVLGMGDSPFDIFRCFIDQPLPGTLTFNHILPLLMVFDPMWEQVKSTQIERTSTAKGMSPELAKAQTRPTLQISRSALSNLRDHLSAIIKWAMNPNVPEPVRTKLAQIIENIVQSRPDYFNPGGGGTLKPSTTIGQSRSAPALSGDASTHQDAFLDQLKELRKVVSKPVLQTSDTAALHTGSPSAGASVDLISKLTEILKELQKQIHKLIQLQAFVKDSDFNAKLANFKLTLDEQSLLLKNAKEKPSLAELTVSLVRSGEIFKEISDKITFMKAYLERALHKRDDIQQKISLARKAANRLLQQLETLTKDVEAGRLIAKEQGYTIQGIHDLHDQLATYASGLSNGMLSDQLLLAEQLQSFELNTSRICSVWKLPDWVRDLEARLNELSSRTPSYSSRIVRLPSFEPEPTQFFRIAMGRVAYEFIEGLPRNVHSGLKRLCLNISEYLRMAQSTGQTSILTELTSLQEIVKQPLIKVCAVATHLITILKELGVKHEVADQILRSPSLLVDKIIDRRDVLKPEDDSPETTAS